MTADRPSLDVNVDMGESYGRWQLGDDAAIMPYISSASIACGYHAGDPELAGAVAEAIADIDRELLLLLLNADVAPAVEAHGVKLVTEAFVDLEYGTDGVMIIEPTKKAWDPERVAARAVRVALEHRIDATDGSDVPTDAPTICIHGDGPNAVEIARTVKQRLEEAGVALAPLAQVVGRVGAHR